MRWSNGVRAERRGRASAFQGRDGNDIVVALGDHLVELQPSPLAERAEQVLSPLAQAIGPDVGLSVTAVLTFSDR